MSSDATGTFVPKKIHTPSAAAQAQTCTTTASRSSSSDVESILGAEYREFPFQGFLKCTSIGPETTYSLEISLPYVPDLLGSSIDLQILRPESGGELDQRSINPLLCASHANNAVTHSKMRLAASQRKVKRAPWTPEEDAKLRKMHGDGYSWGDIHAALPCRSKAAIQVRCSTKHKTWLEEELPPENTH
jgi:hypothetical protein